MVHLSPLETQPPQVSRKIPPLENGDHLTRLEFERRYAAADVEKAELIEGVVYLASPLRFASHAEPHAQLITWLSLYQIQTPPLRLGIEPTIRLDEENEPQPDGVLLIPAEVGGGSWLTEDDYIIGAPELLMEIAASSASIDLNTKKAVYQRHGVQEYIVWQIFENRLDWFELVAGEYVALTTDVEGVIKSRVFPGLWLKVPALLGGQMQDVLTGLQAGMQSPEYQEFVQGISGKGAGKLDSIHRPKTT